MAERSDLLIGNGFLAALDASEEVHHVLFAHVEFDGSVGQIALFGLLDLRRAVGVSLILVGFVIVETGDGFAPDDEHKLAAVNQHFAARAKEMHAESVFVFQGDAAGIDQFRAAFGVGIGGRNHFHRAAVVHAQAPLGDVQVVCAPIAHHAAAILLEIAPIGKKPIAAAARTQHGVVAAQRRRAAPQVPIQSRLQGFLRQIARPAGIAEAALHVLNRADDAVAHQFARHAKFMHGTLHGAGLQDALVPLDGFDDFHGLVNVVRQRLLAIDVLAGAQRGQRDDRVPVVGRGDANRVNVLAGDEVGKIVVSGAVAVAMEFVHFLLGVVPADGVHVAHRQHARVLPEKIIQQAARLNAQADKAHGQARAGGRLRRPNAGGQEEGRRRRHRGGLKEMPAVDWVAHFHDSILCCLVPDPLLDKECPMPRLLSNQ